MIASLTMRPLSAQKNSHLHLALKPQWNSKFDQSKKSNYYWRRCGRIAAASELLARTRIKTVVFDVRDLSQQAPIVTRLRLREAKFNDLSR